LASASSQSFANGQREAKPHQLVLFMPPSYEPEYSSFGEHCSAVRLSWEEMDQRAIARTTRLNVDRFASAR
jgi:hypothetical protein